MLASLSHLFFISFVASLKYHKPIQSHPGTCVNHVGDDMNDVGAIVWVALAQRWIMTDQKNLLVLFPNGTVEKKSKNKVDCKGMNSHEGMALVDSPRCSNDPSRRCYSPSDCVNHSPCDVPGPFSDHLWVQDEVAGYRCMNDPAIDCATTGQPEDTLCKLRSNESTSVCRATGALCRFSLEKILRMGEDGFSKTPDAEEEVFIPGIPYDSDEGLAFVPDTNSDARYNGTFFWGEQNNARYHKFTLHASLPSITWGDYIKPPSGCSTGEELSDAYYDFVQRHFYSQSDGGNRFTVHDTEFTTCYARVDDPSTCREEENGYEGLAFGGGKFAYVDDAQNHVDDEFHGIWIFDDDFCGDDVKVSTEVCDGLDLAKLDCSTAPAGSCANSNCGSGYTGPLSCAANCLKFDDSQCSGGLPVLLIGLSAGGGALVLVAAGLACYCIRRRKLQQNKAEALQPYQAIN